MKWTLSLLIFITTLSFSQELKLSETIPIEADTFVGVDAYNDIYYIKNNELFKKGRQSNYNFNNVQLGAITRVDIVNPLRIVVYYEDFNTVVFLDNRLNEMKRLNFNDADRFINLGGVTNAGNNRLWLFNIDSQQLELFNYNTLEKAVIAQPISETYTFQTSDFNYCLIQTPQKAFLFNIYGSLLSTIDTQPQDRILLHNDRIAHINDATLTITGISDSKKRTFTLPQITIKDLYLSKEFLYIYDSKNIYTFALTQP